MALALEEHVHQCGFDAEEPDRAGDAAASGKEAEADLGKTELDLRVVDDDAAVAGQRDFQPASERGAGDRGDRGDSQRLEFAQRRCDSVRRVLCGRRLV